jgi:hypothetical protein
MADPVDCCQRRIHSQQKAQSPSKIITGLLGGEATRIPTDMPET